jgi:hypothetical protein
MPGVMAAPTGTEVKKCARLAPNPAPADKDGARIPLQSTILHFQFKIKVVSENFTDQGLSGNAKNSGFRENYIFINQAIVNFYF